MYFINSCRNRCINNTVCVLLSTATRNKRHTLKNARQILQDLGWGFKFNNIKKSEKMQIILCGKTSNISLCVFCYAHLHYTVSTIVNTIRVDVHNVSCEQVC